jgi:hypothetical protein
MTREYRVEPSCRKSELAILLRELRLILLRFWLLIVPWQERMQMTVEERAKFEAYVRPMRDHNLAPRTAEGWLEHYRSVQARKKMHGR